MKLALISAGIFVNDSIKNELKNFIRSDKDFDDVDLLFCITAANYEGGGMSGWLLEDLEYFKRLGMSIDVCDINGAEPKFLLERFEDADILYFGGGITQWLRSCIKKSGLEEHLPKLLETKIWIGVSAGSCVLAPTVSNPVMDINDDEVIEGYPVDGLGLVDFQFIPHLNSEFFEDVTEENVRKACTELTTKDGKKLYALDDESAMFIDGENIKIVSEGTWFEIDIA